MPAVSCVRDDARPCAAEWNRLIRAFTAGRVVWSPEALAELGRLRGEWQAAVAREAKLAA